MRLQKLLPVWLAYYCAAHIRSVDADIPPYFKSAEYDEGKLGKWPHQLYRSSNAIGPILNVQQHDPSCDDDGRYFLLGPFGDDVSLPGPVILNHQGSLVWNDPSYGQTWALDVKTFQGNPYLTFWADKRRGRSNAAWYLLNSSYDEVHTIRPAGGWTSDDHDMDLTLDDTAVIVVELEIPFDLTSVGGPQDGWILDTGFQELDVQTGELLFQWQASAHWNLTESYHPVSAGTSEDTAWDFFHLNSVQKDSYGNYLVSSRHMSTIAYIDGSTGEVRWKLGGKMNEFYDILSENATEFNGQHHANFLEGSFEDENSTALITVFDNGSGGQELTHPTQGKLLEVHLQGMTVQLRQRYHSPHPKAISTSRGSMQALPNGHMLLGFGSTPAWAEFSADGTLLSDVHFGPESRFGTKDVFSYRVLKKPWFGQPNKRPSLAVADNGGSVYVSWNGETGGVTTWELQGVVSGGAGYDIDAGGEEYVSLSTTQREGFETEISIPEDGFHYQYIRVVGRDEQGTAVGDTMVVDRYLSEDITGGFHVQQR